MPDLLEQLRAAFAGRYAIERELGHGGMAHVFLAQDLKHHRPVAIKVLRPELAQALGPERFLREIEIAARLTHPHILALYDSGEARGLLYYVMPYVEGESLRDRLNRESQLPVEEAVRIATQVASALSYAHSHDVVHRDIKPENILLAGGEVVVADFGIARAITAAGGEQLTSTGIAVGTPAYMSPEQGAGEPHLDGRSDLYSLGCVVYEMLAGAPPFTGPTAQAIQARRMTDPVPPLRTVRETVPEAVERALEKALAKVPADRFAKTTEFANALGPSLEPPRALRKLARQKLLAGGVALAAVATVLLVGAVLLAGRHKAADTAAASRVVVMPFENRTASADLDPLGTMVAEWVTQGLIELPFLTVLDTRGAQTAARTLGAGAAPTAVGRETGAGVVVAGSYLLQDDSLQFLAQISSTTNGTVLVGISGVMGPRDHPLDGVERLRQRVLAAFAVLHDKDVSTFQTALAQPPTYASYREYVEGLESYMGGGAGLGAAERFQRAAVLDTTFVAARIWTAQAGLTLVFRMDQVWGRRVDSLITGLMLIRQRLTPFDRARLDFVVALRDGSRLEQHRAALRLLDAAPGSVDARREVALTALRVLRPREALRRLDEIDPERGLLREWDGYWSAAAWAHHLLGQHGDELAVVRRGRRQHASSPDFLYIELRALAALGRTAEVDSLMRVELPGSSGQAAVIAFGIAGELMAHGHAEAAQHLARYAFDHPGAPPPSEQAAASEWLERHIELRGEIGDPWCFLGGQLERRSPAERARDEWLHWRAELALLLGDVETAATSAAELRDPAMHDLLVARILAARGKPDAARAALERGEVRVLQAQGTVKLAGDFCVLEMNRASVLVRLGDLEKAIEVLSKALGEGAFINAWWGQDGHAYPDFAPLWGNPRFRALIKPRG